MEKQISIIIPTYNMEAYIGKCLDSLLIPEFDQVEVWVVNDGSKDRSSEIAHSYADRYPDSIHVLDKENGNYGSCINAALPLCTGRYIKILDADDTFETNAFSEFVNYLPSVHADVLITPFIIVDETGRKTGERNYAKRTIELNHDYTFEESVKSECINAIEMHSLSYSNDLFKNIGYHQTEGISFTDTQWATIPLAYAKDIRFVEGKPLYRYLLGREGQTMAPQQFDRQIDSYIKLFHDRILHCENVRIAPIRKEYLIQRLIRNMNNIYIQAINHEGKTTIEKLIEFDSEVQKLSPTVYRGLSECKYHQASNFKMIKVWRENNYPYRVKLPFFSRIKISIASHLHK